MQVDIEDMGGEAADGFGSVGLAAEFEVGWFVDQAEVGAVDGSEVGEDLVDPDDVSSVVVLNGDRRV